MMKAGWMKFVQRIVIGMSKGEFTSVARANGGIKYIADKDKLEKILENLSVIKTPVVRNGKQST